MAGRSRSPSYPSTPLEEAIDYVARLHRVERTNIIDREVAAKAMGYSGLTGRSATILSNLFQYGLLEKAGKNEVRVSKRAVEILHPDSERSKEVALMEAAEEPPLFQRVRERYSDGLPSEAALRSFFVKEGFTDTALPAVVSAYMETFRFIENTTEGKRIGRDPSEGEESQPKQTLAARPTAQPLPTAYAAPAPPVTLPPSYGKATFQWDGEKILLSGGEVATQADADKVIQFLNALRPMLRSAPALRAVEAPTNPTAEGTEEDGVSGSNKEDSVFE